MRRFRAIGLGGMALLLLWHPHAEAAFHLWDIAEIYSNADGSIQYIELTTTANGQHVLAGHTLSATAGGEMQTFTFPTNSPTGTTNKRLLIATPGFADLPGAVTPNFTLPCGPFFAPGAASITINFAGADSVIFAGSALPKNGSDSLHRTGAAQLTSAAHSPTNFAGNVGMLNLTACLIAGTCEPCDDGVFCNGAESCAGFACVDGAACTQICDEAEDTCVECDDPGDCNDDNPCTDDTCDADVCENSNNTAACNDGLFCTASDGCSGGVCVGTGDPCAGQNCSEGLNACVACLSPADCNDANPCTDDGCVTGNCSYTVNTASCDDGLFCTMVDQCSAGVCGGAGDSCPGQICDEGGDACLECDEDGDCDDANACTSDACVAGACEHQNVTLGTPCESDGTFCNGPEQCASGQCQSLGDPCDAGTACNEQANECQAPEGGGAGPGGAGPDAPGSGGAGPEGGGGPDSGAGPDTPEAGRGGRPGGIAGNSNTAGGGAAAIAGSAGNEEASEEDDGCGCRVAGNTSTQSGWLVLLALAALARRRSRRAA